MRTYLSTLLGVSVVSAVVRAISPEGAMKKYIEVFCSICVISALISPVAAYISELDGIEDILDFEVEYESSNYDEIYNEYLLDTNTADACRALENELSTLLGTDTESIKVSLDVSREGDEVSVNCVNVTLGVGAIAADPEQIKNYVQERVGCECQIIYDITDK